MMSLTNFGHDPEWKRWLRSRRKSAADTLVFVFEFNSVTWRVTGEEAGWFIMGLFPWRLQVPLNRSQCHFTVAVTRSGDIGSHFEGFGDAAVAGSMVIYLDNTTCCYSLFNEVEIRNRNEHVCFGQAMMWLWFGILLIATWCVRSEVSPVPVILPL